MILLKAEVMTMKNTKRFGKVRTSEEYLIFHSLEKEIETQKQNKKVGDTRERCIAYLDEMMNLEKAVIP